MMDFESVFRILIDSLEKEKIDFALIGGFALPSSGVVRATRDIDLLILKEDAAKVKKIMSSCGYELIHESEDVSNYAGKTEQLGNIDFLHAHRKYAKAMLGRSKESEILGGKFTVKVIKTEDLIGLKVQSSSNDPRRYHRDMADIEALIRINYKNLDMALLKEYFALFEREKELERIIKEVKDAE